MSFVYHEKPLLQILDETCQIAGTTLGIIQVYNNKLGGLQIVVQRGFKRPYLDFFRLVRSNSSCACGRAFRLEKRVIIVDVRRDPFFSLFLLIAQEAGFRGVLATPILNGHGKAIGVLSTYCEGLCELSHGQVIAIGDCATQAALVIDSLDEPPQEKND